jgi:endoglucanase
MHDMSRSMRDILLSLLRIHGATGREEAVAAWLADLLRPHVDELRTDVMGNLIAVKKAKTAQKAVQGKRIMFSAHMDHIGLLVIDADKHGFLRVCSAGGVRMNRSLGQHVMFANGVCGVISAEEDVAGDPEMRHLYIDIGASAREEALACVSIGDVAVYAAAPVALGEHRIAAPAMDDRAGCALLAWLLLDASDCPNEIVGVFSAQEEVGLRGAQVAAYAVEPDIGVALDVTATGDVPGVKPKMAMELGKGPAVKIMDHASISSPVVRDAMISAAKEHNIPYQLEVLSYGGTDAGAIQLSRAGVPSGTLSIATRYVHSAIETLDMRDMEQGGALLLAFVQTKF